MKFPGNLFIVRDPDMESCWVFVGFHVEAEEPPLK